MIRLPDVPLPATAQQKLHDLQAEVDAQDTHEKRVARADEMWKSRTGNQAFEQIRGALRDMCSGNCRCAYCEDNCANQIEHIKPKSLYPEDAFAWENYLYACGNCNGPKNNQWAVFSARTGTLTHVRKGKKADPPEPGAPVFINPRQEDPRDFMQLDLNGTFQFVIRAQKPSRDHERADYTIKILGLNDRDVLIRQREDAWVYCESLLHVYIERRDAHEPQDKIDRVITALRRVGHRTVWEEMKLRRNSFQELKQLFDQAPEALDW